MFLRLITCHLSCYSEIKKKTDDYWGEYDYWGSYPIYTYIHVYIFIHYKGKVVVCLDREALNVRKFAGDFSPNRIQTQTTIVIAIRKSTSLSTEPWRRMIRLHGSVDREVDFLIGITIAVWVWIPFGEKCPASFLTYMHYVYIYICIHVCIYNIDNILVTPQGREWTVWNLTAKLWITYVVIVIRGFFNYIIN